MSIQALPFGYRLVRPGFIDFITGQGMLEKASNPNHMPGIQLGAVQEIPIVLPFVPAEKIEDSVRRQLTARREAAAAPPRWLPVFAGDGLLPGVDLDDSAALLDLMERE